MSENSSAKLHPTRFRRALRALFGSVGLSLWVLAGFVSSLLIVQFIISTFQSYGVLPLRSDGVGLLVLFGALTYVGSLLIVVGLPRLLGVGVARDNLKKLLGLSKKPTLGHVGMALVGYAAYFVLFIVGLQLLSRLFPGFNSEQPQVTGFESIAGSYEYILAFVTLVIVAPLAEELLFRGYLFTNLRLLIPFVPATLITSALFGLVHGQLNVGVDVFLLSLVLCYVREKSDSLWPAVFLHAAKNSVAFYVLFIL